MAKAEFEHVDEETWSATCTDGNCGFTSTGWPTKARAERRMRLHATEHETGEPMSELHEFLAEEEGA